MKTFQLTERNYLRIKNRYEKNHGSFQCVSCEKPFEIGDKITPNSHCNKLYHQSCFQKLLH